MKKLMFAVLAVLFVAPAAFADDWGLGAKLGAGENDPKDMKAAYDGFSGSKELDRNPGYFGLEAFYEMDLNEEANKLGFKVGWDIYGENEVELKGFPYTKVTETTYSFPVTVYYKRDNGIKNVSWFAGAGATFLRTEIEMERVNKKESSKNKIFPHIVVGGEYRFTQLFALGLEARYNFNARVKKDGEVFSDRSGFGAAITGRFYF